MNFHWFFFLVQLRKMWKLHFCCPFSFQILLLYERVPAKRNPENQVLYLTTGCAEFFTLHILSMCDFIKCLISKYFSILISIYFDFLIFQHFDDPVVQYFPLIRWPFKIFLHSMAFTSDKLVAILAFMISTIEIAEHTVCLSDFLPYFE